MKHKISIAISCFISSFIFAQSDFSDNWTDLYSYNSVKDFTIDEDRLIAITENAMFITDLSGGSSRKFSSVNGLSGATTSSVGFDNTLEYTLIGYENGLVEMVSSTDDVIPITGVRDNSILVNKEVRGFLLEENYKYAYGDFGIVELRIVDVEFGDSFKLTNSSLPTVVYKALVLDDVLYAATEVGVYKIDLNAGLSPESLNNWELIKSGNTTDLAASSNDVYFVQGNTVFNVEQPNTGLIDVSSGINAISLKDTDDALVVTMSSLIHVYDLNTLFLLNEVDLSVAVDYVFTTNEAIVSEDKLYVQTSDYGVLRTDLTGVDNEYVEFHPEGPSGNDVFSVTARDNNVWLSYGGYGRSYGFGLKSKGISGFYNNNWYNIPFAEIGARDITKIEINPLDPSKIYAASYFTGVQLLEYAGDNDSWSKTGVWNPDTTNNGIQDLTVFDAVISYLAIDNNDKLWVNSLFSVDYEFLSRYNFRSEEWETHVNFSNFFDAPFNDIRIINTFFDDEGNGFCGTSRFGLIAFKENHDENLAETSADNLIRVIDNSNSNLSSLNVRAVVSDSSNGVWIGTDKGVTVLRDNENLFNATSYSFATVIIEEDGEAKEFLADTQINDIIIDEAGNKWFGTNGSGLFYTSSDAQTTYEIFKTGNSPLPSDIILDLDLDKETGLIYIVTEKGVVSYDPQNEPFGVSVTEVVAYPNPAIRNVVGHEQITIVAKDGGGIPEGTNVKIMDVSGKLVYETNVGSDSSAIGGKVVWDKRNLRGNYVVSGVYIVLLSSPDAAETTTTKIAIVN